MKPESSLGRGNPTPRILVNSHPSAGLLAMTGFCARVALHAILALAGLLAIHPAARADAWRQERFIIGTWWDPCQESAGGDSSKMDDDVAGFVTAIDAYINLFTGTQLPSLIDHRSDGMKRALGIVALARSERLDADPRYLVSDERACRLSNHPLPTDYDTSVAFFYKTQGGGGGLSDEEAERLYGFRIVDEPASADADTVTAWIELFKTYSPEQLAYINLYGRGGPFASDAAYEAYLDRFLLDPSATRRPDVVSYDFYPLHADGTFFPNYFYTMSAVRQRAGRRPIWAYPMSNHHSSQGVEFVDAQEEHMRLTAFCPIAYGAKGLIWFTYELKLSNPPNCEGDYCKAPVINCDSLTAKYYSMQRINHYLDKVLGPVVMGSEYLGVWHKTFPAAEALPASEQLYANNAPVVRYLTRDEVMVAAFRDTSDATCYYLLLVNKSLGSKSVIAWLKGDYQNHVELAPSVVGYAGSTTYTPATTVYSENETRFGFILEAGEGRLVRVTNVLNPRTSVTALDFDGDGRADTNRKDADGRWLIDCSLDGLGIADTLDGYGGADWQAAPADYDGDGRADLAVLTSDGRWGIDYRWDGFEGIEPGDWTGPIFAGGPLKPAPADYDGDGKADLGVLHTAVGTWDIDYSSNGFGTVDTSYSGYPNLPAPADFDGDGRGDLATYGPSGGLAHWLINDSEDGLGGLPEIVCERASSEPTEAPAPADYDGDGKADLGLTDGLGHWIIDYSGNGYAANCADSSLSGYAAANSHPAPGDFDRDGRADLSVRYDCGSWRVDYAQNGFQGLESPEYPGFGSGVSGVSAVSDLSAEVAGSHSVVLTWSSPGPALAVCGAGEFEIRRSNTVITTENWNSATLCSTAEPMPLPGSPGTPQCVSVTGLAPGTPYYFALKTWDRGGNWTVASNNASITTRTSGGEVYCEGDGLMAEGGDDGAWVLENTLDAGSAADVYRFRTAIEAVGGRYEVRLRQRGGAEVGLKGLTCATVDYSAGSDVLVAPDGVRLVTTAAVTTVKNHSGLDVTAWMTGTQPKALIARRGEVLTVGLGDPGIASQGIVVELGGYSAASSEAAGLVVRALGEDGQWREASRIRPRRLFDTFFAQTLGSDSLRIEIREDCAVKSIKKVSSSELATPQALSLSQASHSSTGDVSSVLSAGSGSGLAMASGDTLLAAFTAIKVPAGKERRLVLGLRTSVPGTTTASRRLGEAASAAAPPTYETTLGPARPNPSRGTVTIGYSLAEETPVSIRVYNVAGRLVTTLVQGPGEAGPHEVVWDARDDGGRTVAAGVYFYTMTAGSWQSQRKVVFLER
jgi:hypothetical protein